MKSRPILFGAPMVRAILADLKGQTRRRYKPRYPEPYEILDEGYGPDSWPHIQDEYGDWHKRMCPYGVPGDQLWVRETWAWLGEHHFEDHASICYRADIPDLSEERAARRLMPGGPPWRPSIHMPRWASRITLEVTDVRVQRLQDISEEDARAEGVTPFPADPEADMWHDGTHRTAFEFLWCDINGWQPNAWEANPWCWCLTFRRLP